MTIETETIAQLQLPDHLKKDADQFVLHPSLMDGALQTIYRLLHADHQTYLPFSMGEIEIVRQYHKKVYAYVIKTSAPDAKLSTFQIQITDETGNVMVQVKDFIVRLLSVQPVEKKKNVFYYHPEWEQQALLNNASDTSLTGSIMVFDNEADLVQLFRERFPHQLIIHATPGDQFNKQNVDDYIKLLNQLKQQGNLPTYIIYRTGPDQSKDIHDQLQQIYYPLFYLAQALIKLKLKENIHVICVNEIISPFTAALSGFAKAVNLEYPELIYRIIDIPNLKTDGIQILFQELASLDTEVRYTKDHARYIKRFKESIPSKEVPPLVLKKEGVYLITGGAGGLGLIFARYLAEAYQAKLILTGRSALNDKQKASIVELEKLGAEVLYARADVTQLADIRHLIDTIKNRFGSLNGIIHGAGVLRDALISKKTPEKIADVLAPKITGTMCLDEVTQSEPLDFFVMFSSIVSIFGNIGQCDYAYANGFMDAFAEQREILRTEKKRSGKTIAINWPLWAEGGMQIDKDSMQWLEKTFGVRPLATADGITAFKDALTQMYAQQIVLPGEKEKLERALENG